MPRDWDTYRDRFGPLNRFTEHHRSDDTIARRVPTAIRIFSQDPGAGLVLALEDYDPGTGLATPPRCCPNGC